MMFSSIPFDNLYVIPKMKELKYEMCKDKSEFGWKYSKHVYAKNLSMCNKYED